MASVVKDCIVLGAGPAGIFAALAIKNKHPSASVLILEKSSSPLKKLLLSGGGRCNVTNECFDPKTLVRNYPRGSKELLGAFHRFQPRDMMHWLEERGVSLHVEAEGRVFPSSNRSETIAQCLLSELRDTQILFQQNISSIEKKGDLFSVNSIDCKNLIIATGSSIDGYEYAKIFGHSIVNPVPSLFSFTLDAVFLRELAGISFSEVELRIPGTRFEQAGPLLITHLGMSGPAVLKLSAWAARYCAEQNYDFPLEVNWLPQLSPQEIESKLQSLKISSAKKLLSTENIFQLPKNFWNFCIRNVLSKKIIDISNKEFHFIAEKLHKDCYHVTKKSPIKDEFVTCGGVSLKEIDFQTMQSKLCKNLFFAGEVLDIDGLTGGFNLQSAWTTGFIAGSSVVW